MQPAPVGEYTSPLDAHQAQQLTDLIETLTPTQVTWISGYLAGLNAHSLAGEVAAPAVAPAASATASEPLTILYGSQTGNAEDIAGQLAERAEAVGLTVATYDMLDYKPRDLKKEKNLIVCVSTHGEGDPPDNAEELHAFIFGKKAPKLDSLRFSVLAFGDASYAHFCQTGKDFDARLEKLGGQRVVDRVYLDVDFDEPADAWMANAIDVFADELGGEAEQPAHPTVTILPGTAEQPAVARYSRKNPHAAEVLDNTVLNGRGSAKEVHHIELDTEDSGLVWQPGDSLGVIPENGPAVVTELIGALGLNAEETVTGTDGETTLEYALAHDYEITTLTRPLVEKYAERAGYDALNALLAEDKRAELAEYMAGRFLIDLVDDYPIPDMTGADFVRLLRRMPPRLYSIASSHAANPDEIHLTVAAVRYESYGRARHGVASVQLADRSEDAKLPVYIDTNKNFKLPKDDDAPIIMIGPGTGVAPFRAFLEEREDRGATGDNWLFFGAQHFRTDFYYQTDWLRWRDAGLLTRMDAAFSRDGDEKIYVQDKIRAAGSKVFAWIERGATVYVCGDANAMATDVHEALLDVIGEHGQLNAKDAAAYLKTLQKEKRYQRDVY